MVIFSVFNLGTNGSNGSTITRKQGVVDRVRSSQTTTFGIASTHDQGIHTTFVRRNPSVLRFINKQLCLKLIIDSCKQHIRGKRLEFSEKVYLEDIR